MGTASTKAKNKYNDANYDRISLTIKKGLKDKWKEAAEQQGKSLNQFIVDCIEYDLACTNLLKDPEFIKELEEHKALEKEG